MTEHLGLTSNIFKKWNSTSHQVQSGIDYTALRVQGKENRRIKNVIFPIVRFIVGPDAAGLKGEIMQVEHVR